MTYSIDKHCNTAEEFIDYFSSALFLKPKHIFDAYNIGLNGFIFRGHSDYSWTLLPTAFRSGNPLKDYTPQTAGIPENNDFDPICHLGWHMHSELRALFIFLETADKLGIDTPIEYTNLKEHNELINNALDSKYDDHETIFPSAELLNSMALAQHHGIQTRLLDWTESPYVAAFFAAINGSPLTEQGNIAKSEKISVIYLQSEKLRKENSVISVVNAPRRSNTFLRFQKGLFTYIPKANSYFIENKKWPSLEDINNLSGKEKVSINRVTLDSSQSLELLKILYPDP